MKANYTIVKKFSKKGYSSKFKLYADIKTDEELNHEIKTNYTQNTIYKILMRNQVILHSSIKRKMKLDNILKK